MAYSYPNIASKEIKAGSLSFTAVAENEISSLFDCLEECAETTVSVIVFNESGEQIATVEFNPGFYFSEGYSASENRWNSDAFHFDFGPDDGSIAMAAHEWDHDETTPDDVAALETAAGKPCAFWDAAEAAAADVCRRLENDVRALRFEDTADCVNFPTYAIGYLFNADPSGMEAEDIKNFDNWFNRITNNGELHVNFDSVNPGDDPYFSSCPAFGLPAECERVAVTYFPDL